eukprot:9489713-Pyramimonas_sp.AAC.2
MACDRSLRVTAAGCSILFVIQFAGLVSIVDELLQLLSHYWHATGYTLVATVVKRGRDLTRRPKETMFRTSSATDTIKIIYRRSLERLRPPDEREQHLLIRPGGVALDHLAQRLAVHLVERLLNLHHVDVASGGDDTAEVLVVRAHTVHRFEEALREVGRLVLRHLRGTGG